jgi:exopolysaccharide biosynthesis polyprenyl glycosylphosphotransferase
MKTDEARLDLPETRLGEAVGENHLSGLVANRLFLLLVDLLIGAGAYAGAWLIRVYVPLPFTQDLLPQERWDVVSHFWPVLVLSQGFFLYIFGMYDDLRVMRYREVVTHVFTACLSQVVAVTSIFYLTNGVFPRSVILIFGLFNLLALLAWRLFAKSRVHTGLQRVLVVGESLVSVQELTREIRRNPWMGLKVVGIAADAGTLSEETEELEAPLLGSLEEAPELIARHEIDEIVFASQSTWKDRVLHSVSRLQVERPLRIAILPSVYEIAIGRLKHINLRDTPLIEVKRNPNEPFERLVKRCFDVVIASFCLLLLSPVVLLIAAAIILNSGGPVFYLQERVGRGGKTFRLIKFRTMIADAERESGETFAQPDDPRVTRVGAVLRRLRLDEVPQFLNVLKGDMSFVGPRPERPGFVRLFSKSLPGYNERHKVKPGMTGLAQVRGYYDTAAENKLRYDLAYIYNYSFSLDLLILLETIKVILTRRGS